MEHFSRFAAALTLSLALAAAAAAQDGEPQAGAAPQAGDESPAAPGQGYLAETHGDWALRCVRSGADREPCHLYQLLRDGEGNSVAEITVFPINESTRAVLGATVATPLETLLTRQVTLSVDGGGARRYPFTYCSVQGCFSRIGLTQPEVDAFRQGNAATIAIVPLAAPDQIVRLAVSLRGFTAGHNALLQRTQPN